MATTFDLIISNSRSLQKNVTATVLRVRKLLNFRRSSLSYLPWVKL